MFLKRSSSTTEPSTSHPDNIELLALYAVCLEIALHVPLWNLKFVEFPTPYNLLHYLGRLASDGIPFFIFITGYLLLKQEELDIRVHARRMLRIFCIFAVNAALLFFWGNGFSETPQAVSLGTILSSILTTRLGSKYTSILWYYEGLLAVYLLYPFIRELYHNQFRLFLYLFGLLSCLTIGVNCLALFRDAWSLVGDASPITSLVEFVNRFSPFSFVWYLFFFCLGGMAYRFRDLVAEKRRLLAAAGIAAILVSYAFGLLMSFRQQEIYRPSLNSSSVFTAFYVIGLFALTLPFSREKGRFCRFLWDTGRYAQVIYLIHLPITWYLSRMNPVDTAKERIVRYVLVVFLCVLAVSILRKLLRESAGIPLRDAEAEAPADPGSNRRFSFWKNHPGIRRLVVTFTLLLPLAAVLFPPNLNLELRIRDVVGKGNIFIYCTHERQVMKRYICEKPVQEGDTYVLFPGIQTDINNICLDTNNLEQVGIEEATVNLYGIPIYHYYAQDLYNSVQQYNGVEISVDHRAMTVKKTGDDDYINLKKVSYYGPYTWVLWLLLLSALCLALAVPIVYFVPALTDYFNVLWPVSASAAVIAAGEILNRSLCAAPLYLRLLSVAMGSVILLLGSAVTWMPVGVTVGSVILAIYFAGNHFVRSFRGRPILPADFSVAGTALEVAGTYTFTIVPKLWALIIVTALVILIGFIFQLRLRPRHTLKRRGAMVFFSLLMAGIMALLDPFAGLFRNSWNDSIIYAYRSQGALPALVSYAEEYHVKVPENYSDSHIREIVDKYPADSLTGFRPADDPSGLQPERILMVMNESFADLPEKSPKVDIDTIPFVHSLRDADNTVSGHLYVSVLGGGTCNTEFETMTGNSMAFLPANTYPYVAYIKRDLFSLARLMAANSYDTASLHIEAPNNWFRTAVYGYLGLEPFHSIKDYQDRNFERINSRASDAFDYEVLQEIEESMEGDRKFIFNVTVQNHGGYLNAQNVPQLVDLSEYGDYGEAATFFSLMKISDEETRKLVERYKNDDTRTMIIFYGDHQPYLNTRSKVMSWLFDGTHQEIDDYVTPFFIWCNYDIPEEYYEETYHLDQMSANYMPWLIAKIGNFPMPTCLKILEEVRKEYPVITAMGVYDKDGKYYASVYDAPDENGVLADYQCIQYNNLMDKKPNPEVWELKP